MCIQAEPAFFFNPYPSGNAYTRLANGDNDIVERHVFFVKELCHSLKGKIYVSRWIWVKPRHLVLSFKEFSASITKSEITKITITKSEKCILFHLNLSLQG